MLLVLQSANTQRQNTHLQLWGGVQHVDLCGGGPCLRWLTVQRRGEQRRRVTAASSSAVQC